MAPTEELFSRPCHPYTRALLASVPSPDPDVPMPAMVSGEVADPGNLPAGCSFHPRCPCVSDACRDAMPPLKEVEPGHLVRCLQPEDASGHTDAAQPGPENDPAPPER
jgi:peptide/nickel transport system ATP-binding protein